jgi:pimeloyl-ACP methyl ester carboxylesterase
MPVMNKREKSEAATPKIHRATVNIGGLDIFYLDTASGGPPMLCLHGRWGRGQTWADLMLRYRDRYRVLAPDQRGHGLSDKPVARYASEDMAADASGLLRKLGVGPAIVVGHSMGGRIAAHLAAIYPEQVKALAVLDESAAGPDTMSDLAPEDIPIDDKLTAGWPTPYPTYAEAVADLKGRFKRETNVRYFLESLTETKDGYDYLFSRRATSAIAAYHEGWFDMLPKIKCPVLLVRASQSWCLSVEHAQMMRAKIEDCTYCEIEGSDHMVYADNQEEFYIQFEAFLDRV